MKVMETNIWYKHLLMKAKTYWESMKNYGGKSENLLDQQVTIQTIVMKN